MLCSFRYFIQSLAWCLICERFRSTFECIYWYISPFNVCSLARPTIIYGYSTNKIRRCFAHSLSLSSLLFQAGGIIVRISWISKDVVFIRNSHFAFGDIVVLRYDDDDRYTSVDGVVVASSSCAFIAFYLALRTKRSSSRWWFIHRNKIEIMSQQP